MFEAKVKSQNVLRFAMRYAITKIGIEEKLECMKERPTEEEEKKEIVVKS